ncbi:MAG: hypothetical protein KJ052_03765 [Candidatus Hydrogenedentes bacterium]|nr:hypothetical protein [Candidatus Hydrogenedentota bacterium]
MSENEQRGLERLDIERQLPSGFSELSAEEKRDVLKRLADQDIEIRGDVARKVWQSKIAQGDLDLSIETVERLSPEKKTYSVHAKGETGSGTYDVIIRGGDTKFIVPVIIAIGVVIVAIILIVKLF